MTNGITFSGVLKKASQRAETEIIVSVVVVATIIIIAIVIIMCVIYRKQTTALVKSMNFSNNKITNDIYFVSMDNLCKNYFRRYFSNENFNLKLQ